MKEFVKDYVELCKESGRFYKKHWKGLVVLNALICFRVRGIHRDYYERRIKCAWCATRIISRANGFESQNVLSLFFFRKYPNPRRETK